ncbi:MAG: hypothetical protein IT431_11690 [Phycisphaerales bacterium]|jgi:hypothetical protein|nr:hypothetical protein [Phycisphaerales bacterium]
MTDAPDRKSGLLDARACLDAVLAEYNALYGLAEFRMAALDRRVPAAGATILASVGAIPVLSGPAQHVLLAAVPVSLIWLLRTTINHARSFEDAIRRIEELESAVNGLAGSALMCFQSTHPSRGRAVGGRTSTETVLAVVLWAMVLLGACGYLAAIQDGQSPTVTIAYMILLGAVALAILVDVRGWRRYRYRRLDPPS